ncbi:MAG: MFS transporter [Caldisericaceae bacterium]
MNHSILKNKSLILILLVTASAVAGVSSIAPALPQIAAHFNISPEQSGMALAIFAIPGIFFSMLWGILSDRIGRKTTLIVSLFLFGIAGTISAFVNSYNLFLFWRLLQGIGASSLFSLNVIVIGDLFTGSDRSNAMGYNASVTAIALALFPFLGGVLARVSWNLPLILPSFSIVVAIFVIRYFQEPCLIHKENFSDYIFEIIKSFRNWHIIGIFVGTFIYFFVQYGVFMNYFPYLMKDNFGYSSSITGSIIAFSSIIAAFVAYYVGFLEKYINFKTIYIFSFLIYGISFFLMPVSQSLYVLLGGVALYGVAQGVNMPLTPLLISVYAPEEQRGALMSASGAVLSIGEAVGPLFFSYLYPSTGFKTIFFIGTIFSVSVIGIVSYAFTRNHN